MQTSARFWAVLLVGLGGTIVGSLAALGAGLVVADMNPQMREQTDRERLAVHRLDIVDSNGVIRMTLAAPTPEPRLGGKAYKRVFSVAGLTFYDADGNERGGLGIADVPGSAVIVASDHANMDAVGWRVMPDGSVSLAMNERPPVETDAQGKVLPATSAATRISMSLAADGTPAIALSDSKDRPRVRITVTPEGYGALEFLDASGKVVSTMVPERSTR